MRKVLRRLAGLLLPVAFALVLVYLHTRLKSAGPLYEGLTVADWETEADSLANTSRTNYSYRLGEELRQFTGRPTRLQRFSRLANGQDAEAIPMLTALLESPRGYARLTGLCGLRSRGPLARPALPAIRKALEDSDEDVRYMARQVISNLELLEKLPGN